MFRLLVFLLINLLSVHTFISLEVDSEGIVSVEENGTWYKVCSHHLNDTLASMVCVMAGEGLPISQVLDTPFQCHWLF